MLDSDSMLKTDQVREIFLQPGEHFFGGRETRIHTVLGSCVSLVFWHPQMQMGGMCHYMLPGRPHGPAMVLDGRYADEAVELMLGEMRAHGAQPLREYQVKMFGGGNMFPFISRSDGDHIGSKNVLAAREILRRHDLDCVSEHVEGTGHRNLTFYVCNGQVALKHRPFGRSGAANGDVPDIHSVTLRNKGVSSVFRSQYTPGSPIDTSAYDPLNVPGGRFRK